MNPKFRLKDIVVSLTSAVTLLNEVSDVFGTPFVPAIANTALSLIKTVENVKTNKDECAKLTENVQELLYAIVGLHVHAETPGSLPPQTLRHLGTFKETMHKIHNFVEAQQDGNKIKHFFRQSEMATLLKECHAGLRQATEELKIKNAVMIFDNVTEMRKRSYRMHEELMELISTLSDGTMSERSSSTHPWANFSQNSSNSFSMLPAKPKIFHGRDSDLAATVEILLKDSARIAILGAGGMGKTSLAKTVLHHPDIIARYRTRFFVASDSAPTCIELAALIGSHVGLPPGKNLTKPVLRYFSSSPPALLILDNLETLWEPIESRGEVEEFLSKLSDIGHLGLMITMRGAERPARVRWTRPFLPPLKPLSDSAARQTFFDIAEDTHASEDINQ
ncbi:hypothetical protein C8R44DRAFT_988610, partial [Mycena epipterygia]